VANLIELLNAELAERYTVSEEIGRGGMAVVYLAEDLRHDRRVAIKVLLPELASAVGPDRFLREIQIEAGLRHPGILPLLDSGEVEGLPFYVMPFVAGETLARRLDREKQLPVEEVIRIGVEVADALAHAHARGLVHRDIKPANLMLDEGHTVVADFGIALATRKMGSGRLTTSGASPGSPLYMSPEQAGGFQDLDGRSDIYSLGCVLYEALTGDPPFHARIPQAVLAKKLSEDPPSVRVVRDAVPVALERIVTRALARNPGDRYPNAEALRDALTGLLEGRAPEEPVFRDYSREEASILSRGMRVAGWGAGGLILVGLIGVLTSRVHDLALRIPPEHTPMRGDFMVLGFMAVVPLAIWALVAVVAFVALRYLGRVTGWVARRSATLSRTVEATRSGIRDTWFGAWRRLEPTTVADLYFLGAVTVAVIALAPYRGILVGMVTPDAGTLGDVWLRRSFLIVLTLVILLLAVTWRGVFRYLGARGPIPGRVAFARWASLAWIVGLLVLTTMPWQLLNNLEGERVLLDGRPGYLLRETASELLIFDPELGETVVRPPESSARLQRFDTRGYPFEGLEAFRRRAPME